MAQVRQQAKLIHSSTTVLDCSLITFMLSFNKETYKYRVMFTDRDAAAEESFATQECSGADVSSTARSYDQLLPAGTFWAYIEP